LAFLTAIAALLSFFLNWQYWLNMAIALFIATVSFYRK